GYGRTEKGAGAVGAAPRSRGLHTRGPRRWIRRGGHGSLDEARTKAHVTGGLGPFARRIASMDSLLVVFASFVAGVLLRRSPRAPKDAHRALNAFVLDVALPAVVLRAVPRLAFDLSVVGAALMPWIVFALAGALLWPLGRALGWSTRTRGALILTAGLGNTSFVGDRKSVV